jgi:aminodeoxyfutalosine synthase
MSAAPQRTIPDPALRARIASGERVSEAEALFLFQHWPLHDLGALAFARKRALHGDVATFIVNKQINPTNLCVHACKFCEFAAKPGDAHAYSLEEDEIIASIADPDLAEVHIVGGLWKTWNFERALGLVRRIRATYPAMWIKAFTAVEIDFFAKVTKQTWQQVLGQLRDAGMDGLPGGGAEVLSERVHQELYKDKMGPEKYVAVHEAAHALGIPTNCTLLFGHIETDEELISHLIQLRTSQDKHPGFEAFIPLVFQPGETGIRQSLISPMQCLRVIAISRLVLDNVPHIKAYWPTLQMETAVTALTFGADDLDGTIGQERIMQLAGTGAPEGLAIELMHRLIRDAGQVPMRRSGRFDRLPEAPFDAQIDAPDEAVALPC